MGYVRAKTAFVTKVDGREVQVRRSDDPRRDDDPVVQAFPQYFRSLGDVVEDATAEPGRKRRRGRPPGKAAAAPEQSVDTLVSEGADPEETAQAVADDKKD